MIQDKLKTLADNCCLAMCYEELWGIHDDGDKLKILAEAIRQGYVEWGGTVVNPIGLARLCGHKEIVDIKRDTTYYGDDTVVARFVHNSYNHFVLWKHGKVVWNPLENSVCVNQGTIESYRIPVKK